MLKNLGGRLMHAWNAFSNREAVYGYPQYDFGMGYSVRPDRVRLTLGSERTIVSSIYNQIAIDVSAISVVHARMDQNGRFLESVSSGLNECLSISANVDQSGRNFLQEAVMSLFDEGAIAIVPVDTTINPQVSGGYDIRSLRTGKILDWFPDHIRVEVYNEKLGRKEEVTLPKSMVAIIENPLYLVMNEPNSTLKRLVNKINLLDSIDTQSGSGRLDLFIQLPYTIKSDARRAQAIQRTKDIELQLAGSKYGIAYVDGSEKITQLNRPAENNLLKQVEYLTGMLYNQLGLTESVFNGTADEKTMLNYHNRTVEPVLSAIVNEMRRKFLTKTARSLGQDIVFFRDPFRLVPVLELAEIADKFTRNEILSSNEVRAIIGYKPSNQPGADELRNKNLNQSEVEAPPINTDNGENQNGV